MHEQFESLFSRAQTSRTDYASELPAETQHLLESFERWCELTLSVGTSRSYKSHVAKALAKPELKLSSDQKSAIKKFEQFTKS
jgi:hypothetical protein